MKPALLFLVCSSLAVAQDDVAAIVQKVAGVERQLPWFWTPLMEGAGEIPFTFEMKEVKAYVDKQGKATRGASVLQLERIPLDGGSFYRCLAENGASPCSAELANALEQDSHKAANFTADEKARAKAAIAERRARRLAFWTDFPKAFRFQQTGPGEISFAPSGNYRPPPDGSLSGRIKGSFRFDPVTFAITKMEYEMLADAEPASRLYKGSHFSATLADLADHHYLPVKLETVRKLPKGGMETVSADFANYRRFAADSSVQFVDK